VFVDAIPLGATGKMQKMSAHAQKGETVRIAFIDPLSGPFANVGQNQLKSWQFSAEQFNKKNPAA
jgi:branched-chain amino acid transport system substrate-binding protein